MFPVKPVEPGAHIHSSDPFATPEQDKSAVRRLRGRLAAPVTLLAETVRNSHALLAFFALSNADVVIARSVLPDEASGLYAGGLILTKAVLFLPQFVVIVAFPALSTAAARGVCWRIARASSTDLPRMWSITRRALRALCRL